LEIAYPTRNSVTAPLLQSKAAKLSIAFDTRGEKQILDSYAQEVGRGSGTGSPRERSSIKRLATPYRKNLPRFSCSGRQRSWHQCVNRGLEVESEELHRLERRLGRQHVNQRLGVEADHFRPN
jgi:hypothetical protein